MRVLIFCALKLAEAAGVALTLFAMWLLGAWIAPGTVWYGQLGFGLAVVVVPTGLIVLLGIVLAELASANWRWAGRLADRARRRKP